MYVAGLVQSALLSVMGYGAKLLHVIRRDVVLNHEEIMALRYEQSKQELKQDMTATEHARRLNKLENGGGDSKK